jgi:hypothetical protein
MNSVHKVLSFCFQNLRKFQGTTVSTSHFYFFMHFHINTSIVNLHLIDFCLEGLAYFITLYFMDVKFDKLSNYRKSRQSIQLLLLGEHTHSHIIKFL